LPSGTEPPTALFDGLCIDGTGDNVYVQGGEAGTPQLLEGGHYKYSAAREDAQAANLTACEAACKGPEQKPTHLLHRLRV